MNINNNLLTSYSSHLLYSKNIFCFPEDIKPDVSSLRNSVLKTCHLMNKAVPSMQNNDVKKTSEASFHSSRRRKNHLDPSTRCKSADKTKFSLVSNLSDSVINSNYEDDHNTKSHQEKVQSSAMKFAPSLQQTHSNNNRSVLIKY